MRDDDTFDQWIQGQELDCLLTKGEKRQLGEIAKSVAQMASKGAMAVIEAFAKGYGEAVGKAYGGAPSP